MKVWHSNFSRVSVVACIVLTTCLAGAQQKSKSELTGKYEGTAKNNAGEVIDVTLDLIEKEGVVSGTIHSSHGDFPISSGSRQGKTVTLQFDADGTSGTISLETSEGKLAGTWSAGDDGGPLDVKKVAAQTEGAKGKS